MTSYGDAFNDMPIEYREYVATREETEGPMHIDMIRFELQKAHDEGYAVRLELKEEGHYKSGDATITAYTGKVCDITDEYVDMEGRRPYLRIIKSVYRDSEDATMSEADKAIRDGKPRWIHHDQLGWQYVVILENQWYRKPNPLLVYRDAMTIGNTEIITDETPMMLVNVDVEILPHGETPPPAKPEKPKKTAADAKLQVMIQGVIGLLEYVEHGKDEKYIGPAVYSDIRRQCKNMLRKIDYQHPGE